jgi:hypothetical protein
MAKGGVPPRSNPERDWGRPSYPPPKPPKGSVRDVNDGWCSMALPKAVVLTAVAMWRHRKQLFGTGLLLLALSCGGNQHTEKDGKTNCTNAGGRPIPCTTK